MGDIVGGQLALIFDQIVSSWPHVQAGKLRALAITSARRFPTLPELPTVAESGVPNYESISWAGVAVPAGHVEGDEGVAVDVGVGGDADAVLRVERGSPPRDQDRGQRHEE